MPTKASIISKIQAVLTGNATKTTRAEHESYVFDDADSVLNETYKTTYITDNNATTNVFEELDADFQYSLNIKKQGGKVTVSGYIRNRKTISVPMLTGLVKITNAEYMPQAATAITGVSGTGLGSWDATGLNMEFGVSEVTLRTTDVLFSNESISFNFTYLVGQ